MGFDCLSGILVLSSLLPAGTIQGQIQKGRADYQNPALPVGSSEAVKAVGPGSSGDGKEP